MNDAQGGAGFELEDGFDLNGFNIVPALNLIAGPTGDHRVEPKVMAVLVCLAKRSGSLVRHDQLIREVWGPRGATSDLVSRAVGELRTIFGDDATTGHFIETIRKGGYCLRAGVRPMSTPYLRRSPAPEARRAARRTNGRFRPWLSPAIASAMSFGVVALWTAFVCGP